MDQRARQCPRLQLPLAFEACSHRIDSALEGTNSSDNGLIGET